ncbi:MAG: RNA pseudouridine synthase [Treponema sp.]|jgi:23S rRNA pseudouridine1911/1915/1917 synthase|nr:RNA pseudouridine synthase [Treponema sp.]
MENDIASRILYMRQDCLVLNKLPGEAVEGAGEGMGDLPRLLGKALAAKDGAAADALALPQAVHRLDVPVSGCVVFARTRSALQFLNAVFNGGGAFSSTAPAEKSAVEKQYWAIVEAGPQAAAFAASGELVHWIQFDSRNNKSAAYTEPGPGRKKAVLRYRLAGAGKNYLFMEIELVTGRHHQIRAQLARMGLHIKGDLKYGARRSEPHGGIRLHARSLSFPGPLDNGGRVTVQAEPPLQDNLWLAFREAVRSCQQTVPVEPNACAAAAAKNSAAAHPIFSRFSAPTKNESTDPECAP